MSKCVYLLRGVSATGKGTRVSTLMEFLKTKYSCEIREIQPEDAKEPFQIAVVFPEPKFVFIGRWVKSNKKNRLISFSSLDGFSGYKDTLYSGLLNYFSDHNAVFLEGYFGGKNQVLQPKFTIPMGYTDYFVQHFLHSSIEDLQERCVGRSGSQIKGSCWGDNAGFQKEHYRTREITLFQNQFNECNATGKMTYEFVDAKEPVEEYGRKCLINLGLPHLVDEFMSWSKENSTLRNVDNFESNHSRFTNYYMNGDSKTKSLIKI